MSKVKTDIKNNKERRFSKRSILIMIFSMVLVLVAGTYAWYSWRSYKTSMVLTVGDINKVRVTLSPYQINATLDPTLDYTENEYTQVTAVNNKDSVALVSLYYQVESIDTELVSTGFKYMILRSTDGSSYSEYKTGDFTEAVAGEELVILDKDEVAASTTYYYRVYIWVDGSSEDNSSMQGKVFAGELRANISPIVDVTLLSNMSITGGSSFATNFKYTGGVQTFTAPISADYLVKLWGAQGGQAWESISAYYYTGGFGGYTTGELYLDKDSPLYIGVGGAGKSLTYSCGASATSLAGGYNGGGKTWAYHGNCSGSIWSGSGGGATHIATASGILSSLSSNKSAVLAVAGGGGGGAYISGAGAVGGNAGGEWGYRGQSASGAGYGSGGYPTYGGTAQASGTNGNSYSKGTFGQGGTQDTNDDGYYYGGGGGGGYYGGGGAFGYDWQAAGGGGGSGYDGGLVNSKMASYCRFSDLTSCNSNTYPGYEHISTINSISYSAAPLSDYAKAGNGYAIVTIPTDRTGFSDDYYGGTIYYKTSNDVVDSTTFTTNAVKGGVITCTSGVKATLDANNNLITVDVRGATDDSTVCKITNDYISNDIIINYDSYVSGGPVETFTNLATGNTYLDGTISMDGEFSFGKTQGLGFDSNGGVFSESFHLQQFTLETYIKTGTLTSSTTSSLVSNAQNGGVDLGLRGTNIRVGIYSADDSSWISTTTTTSLSSNTKYLLTATYDGTYMKIYVNGEETSSSNVGDITIGIPEDDTVFTFGCDPSGTGCYGYYFRGTMYSGRVYSKVLSASEIAENYRISVARYGS